jgi:hypothetical protein
MTHTNPCQNILQECWQPTTTAGELGTAGPLLGGGGGQTGCNTDPVPCGFKQHMPSCRHASSVCFVDGCNLPTLCVYRESPFSQRTNHSCVSQGAVTLTTSQDSPSASDVTRDMGEVCVSTRLRRLSMKHCPCVCPAGTTVPWLCQHGWPPAWQSSCTGSLGGWTWRTTGGGPGRQPQACLWELLSLGA